MDVGAAAKPPAGAVLTPSQRMFSGRLSPAPTQNDINCVSPISVRLEPHHPQFLPFKNSSVKMSLACPTLGAGVKTFKEVDEDAFG